MARLCAGVLQAVSHHGGGVEVSRRMGWKQVYRPKNFWADLGNCKAELDKFCREIGTPQGVIPSMYVMQQAGRYDLQRALRHWGGASNLADALGYRNFKVSVSLEVPSAAQA